MLFIVMNALNMDAQRDIAWRGELGQVASECRLGTENTRPAGAM